jgi:very-short-patch-repair endonuclease
LDGVVSFHVGIGRGEYPDWALEAVQAGIDQKKLKRLAGAAEKAAAVYTERAAEFIGALVFDPSQRQMPGETAKWNWAALADILDRMEESPESLSPLARFNHATAAMAADGLSFVLPLLGQWAGAAVHLGEFVEYCWHQALMERAFRERPVLANFHARTHDDLVARFRELDRQVLHAARDRVVARHWEGLPRAQSGEGQLGILLRETQKKTRHLPIRQLISQAGRAVQALKPVFLMSPMSVAAFLAPDSVQFDLVVFDEASQVQPVDAFGAILRGRQLVVVGDRHQLPPTRFFERIAAAEAEIDEEEEESLTADLESLLGLCTAQQMRECMLRWHYRSRHQSLISTSNRNFYDNRLYIFPSPAPSAPGALGLVFHHVSEGVYDRGNSRKNRIEADRVVDAIYEHIRTNPERTLGVATFSVAQADAITDALEARRRDDPTGEEFFNAHPHEPFFIKNLESVQGDERDVILISVGYGRDAAGKLTTNFGPLNGQGGERRLNVLITRARCRCEVFCNFRGAELELSAGTPRGVQVLREFLIYAENGRFPVAESAGAEPMSPFEEAVRDAITARGWRVDCQVGSAGYFIDLAVEDPASPGAYLLAIECDGATYHRARSARDRDRLRQQVLEGLGWRFHRIWSTDWFMAPERELERVIAAIEQARLAQGHLPSSAPVAPPPPERSTTIAPTTIGRNIAIYTVATPTINIGGAAPHEVPPSRLVPAIREIVAVEGPISKALIAQRILAALGRRPTTRATAAVEAAITVAAGSKAIVLRGDFAWPADASPALPRDRSGAEAAVRAADSIAPEEWLEAVVLAVAEAHGIPRDRVVNAVAALIGVRVTEEARGHVDAALQRGAASGRLRVQDGTVLVVTG